MEELDIAIVAFIIVIPIVTYGIIELHKQFGIKNFVKEQWPGLLVLAIIDVMVYFMFFTDIVTDYLDKHGV